MTEQERRLDGPKISRVPTDDFSAELHESAVRYNALVWILIGSVFTWSFGALVVYSISDSMLQSSPFLAGAVAWIGFLVYLTKHPDKVQIVATVTATMMLVIGNIRLVTVFMTEVVPTPGMSAVPPMVAYQFALLLIAFTCFPAKNAFRYIFAHCGLIILILLSFALWLTIQDSERPFLPALWGLALLIIPAGMLSFYGLSKYMEGMRIAANVIETRDAELKLVREYAFRDALTGLPNKRHFDEICVESWAEARANCRGIGVLTLDIDHIQWFNEIAGVEAGDLVICEVAEQLKKISGLDEVHLARVGGDMFSLLLPECDLHEAQDLADKLCKEIAAAQIQHPDARVNHLTVSVGASWMNAESSLGARELIARADAGLYKAKRAGRNCVRFA